MSRRSSFASSALVAMALAAAAAGAKMAAQTPPPLQAPPVPPYEPVAAPFDFELSTKGLPVAGRWKSTPVLLDVNGDGFVDLIVHPRLEKQTRVFLGDGQGNWTDSSQGLAYKNGNTCGGQVAPGDFNKDGKVDLAIGDHCEGLFVFLGDGKGKWTAVNQDPINPTEQEKHVDEGENPWRGAEAMGAGDINEDGKIDLITASADRGGFTIYLGDGTGKNWKEQPFSGLPNTAEPGEGWADGGGWSRDVRIVDMNGDKHLDVVASYHRGPRVFLGDGKGKFKAASEGLPAPMMYGIFQELAIADLNGDGRLDLLVANHVNGPEGYLQQADGTWKIIPDMMPPLRKGANSIAAGDLDGDGKMDVVTAGEMAGETQWGIYALRGDGKGGFTSWKTALPEKGQQIVWGLTIADVNGDKRPDVIATLGGAMGAVDGGGGAPSPVDVNGVKVTYPHIQVWLNRAK